MREIPYDVDLKVSVRVFAPVRRPEGSEVLEKPSFRFAKSLGLEDEGPAFRSHRAEEESD